LRFLVDAQLPPALARAISETGHIAEHVGDIGLLDADDEEIWQYAKKNDAAIITKDEDFVFRLRQDNYPATVVWLRLGNSSRQALLKWFLPLLDKILALSYDGEKLIEIR